MQPPNLKKITVLALCGSINPQSSTRRALDVALRGAQEAGAQTQCADLSEYDLPLAGRAFDPQEFPDAVRLLAQVRAAQGVLWGTPEYHGSYSGVLKNALDLMSFEEFEGKMIGLIGVAGGSTGAINALNHLRSVGRHLHAWVLPQQVSLAHSQTAFDDNGKPHDAALEKRLLDLGRDMARFAFLHSTTAAEFVRLWEQAASHPIGDS